MFVHDRAPARCADFLGRKCSLILDWKDSDHRSADFFLWVSLRTTCMRRRAALWTFSEAELKERFSDGQGVM